MGAAARRGQPELRRAPPRLLDQLQQCLAGHFDVEHSTVQFEPASHAAYEHPAHA